MRLLFPIIHLLQKLGSRIIFGKFYEAAARKVFCAAWKIGLYGSKYVWMIPGNLKLWYAGIGFTDLNHVCFLTFLTF